MPKNIKSVQNMSKKMSNAEKEARLKAEESIKRDTIILKKPKGFTKDKAADYHWGRLIKEYSEIELLDNLDADTLARYCKILSRIEKLEKKLYDNNYELTTEEYEKDMIRLESAERSQMTYANKLGLTPDSRTRLAKRKSAPKEIDPDDDLYGGLEVIDIASGD